MMSMAYSTTAEMLPISMACAPTRLPPSHMSSTSAMFIRQKLKQSTPAKIQFTLIAASA